ncbi:LacI family DNA-binding transcriptional regulator [Gordonia sp. zg691]|uniref:LacI family DNA-binding transcriptional regulator n=1 Tax=Gordonia jinghuaiqii TaxID=2758710 RepID=UPI0016626D93|nr:LacI family DNA-binding transcriptional regulator [Gordonia jinghuaiqii]MBD0862585.1 LacI family DNA-binding transcriptional regulator [Gordonia jinghuaiqii]
MTSDRRAPGRPGIRDVATRAGVSPSTVSQALNGAGRISEATRARVRDAAAELGYRPDPAAAGMRSGRTGLVAVIDRVPPQSTWRWDDLEFVVRLVHSVCGAAWEHNRYPVLLPSDSLELRLDGMPFDGAVLIDPLPSDPLLARLDDSGIAAVTMGRDLDRPARRGWADNDKAEQCRQVVELFRRTGSVRPMLLSANTGQSYMHDNTEAFTSLTAGSGRVLELPPSTSWDECRELVRQACAGPEPIDGVYILVEALVQPSLQAIHDAGLSIPDDIQVITSSDSNVSRSGPVSLTSFDLGPERLGHELVGMLVADSADADPRPTADSRLVPVELVERQSTR